MTTQVKVLLNNANLPLLTVSSESPQASHSNLEAVINAPPGGYEGFQLSANASAPISLLDGSYRLYPSGGYPGFISREVSDADGIFATPPSVTIHIEQVRSPYLFISYDNVSQEYPVEVKISASTGYEYYFMPHKWYSVFFLDLTGYLHVSLGDNDVTITLTINKWSVPRASAKITSIQDGSVLTFNDSEILTYECSRNKLNAQLEFMPGISEQYADFRLYDRHGIVNLLKKENVLVDNLRTQVTVSDPATGISRTNTYYTYEWQIKLGQSEFSLICKDATQALRAYQIGEHTPGDRSLHDMLTYCFMRAEAAAWTYADALTEYVCKNIKTPDSWFQLSNVHATLEKICATGVLRIYSVNNQYIVSTLIDKAFIPIGPSGPVG